MTDNTGINVKVWGFNATETMFLVFRLRDMGLKQDVDFDWAYHPGSFANPGHTVFTFYEEKWATWFALAHR